MIVKCTACVCIHCMADFCRMYKLLHGDSQTDCMWNADRYWALNLIVSLLHTKQKKKLIIGIPGNTRDHNFYMGRQNKIPAEKINDENGFFYSHLYIKVGYLLSCLSDQYNQCSP